jgi:hypothetical protein
MTIDANTLYAAAQDPRLFVHTFAHWASGGRWLMYKHLCYVGRAISRAIYTPNSRLIINMPPRVGKSELISYWLPVWFLEMNPARRVILGTHSQPLATKYGRMVRNELNTNRLLSTRVSSDSGAKDEWETTHGGGMKCVGIGTGVTGFGGNLLLVDDPYPSWAKAWSFAYRSEVEDWYDGTASNRLEPGASVIVLHHRMHPKDLTNHLLRKDERWEQISLPAIATGPDVLGRVEGDALCPERYDSAMMQRVRRATPRAIFDAMQQQSPTTVGPGAAYHGFSDRNIAACRPIKGLPIQLSIDFNRTPNMHALIGQHDPREDRLYVYAELIESRKVLDTAEEFCAWIRSMGGWERAGFPELHIFGDASGATKSTQTGQADYAVLRAALAKVVPDAKIRLRVPGANPKIVDRVATFNDALSDVDGEAHYIIHPTCERLITDMREQTMGEDGKPDESDTMLGHAAAAEGYRVHYLRPVGGRKVRQTGKVIAAR